ncbi:MAG: bacteriohopanetetrol glucosamine biosynthesis glycosyltransferase HpnI [Pseudomonadota bacterium]|uniref:bacteriohopanetetrol glucosamine biosynthesis glycosyltransferase HpnI n=1 Tax=Sphingomonas sp. ERG5 TaxID=1381597 RepID=UPI00054BEA2E|nr:bacteriohopanetetrol glucosamine biosynthesis glycosyltransferase HpnI [Sphingomonas sp. ERG5]
MLAFAVIGWILCGLGAAGTLYMVAASIVFRRFMVVQAVPTRRAEAVTLLKPLHGAEPRLFENLESFLIQDHAGPIQLLCGVQCPDDPAIDVVAALRTRYPNVAIDLVIDPANHGANHKISNLVNMMAEARHAILVLSDSDMVATPDYLPRVLSALDTRDVGAMTSLYHGRGDAGLWSRLGAAGLSYQFLPGVVFGVALGLARPCMGSTIAIRRETLDRIGGFARFSDVLADDYAIGEAVRALGQKVAVPPMLIAHASAERSFIELWRHELRWGATVRGVVPGAYIGSVIGMPVPLALLGAALIPVHMTGLAVALASLVVRAIVTLVVDRRTGMRAAPLWLLPIRDCLTFAIFVASFFTASVDWRGRRLKMADDGRVSADPEISA